MQIVTLPLEQRMGLLGHLDVEITGRPGSIPISPSPASWIRVPFSHRAGSGSRRRAGSALGPLPNTPDGDGDDGSEPTALGQTLVVITCPRNDRCTDWISPRPLHMAQPVTSVPGAVRPLRRSCRRLPCRS